MEWGTHRLVDVLDLPITGREEDAVDNFAILIVMDSSTTEAMLY